MLSILTSTMLLASSLFYINVPFVDMREQPTQESKVVSQAFFSEEITIENEKDNWLSIKTSDGYSGWALSEALIARETPYEGTLKTSSLFAHIYAINDNEYGPIITVPFGSTLQALDITAPRWLKVALPNGKEGYIQRGDIAPIAVTNKIDLVSLSQKFLHLPYTWGGRSSFGFDCSGFVQMLYRQIGINLQRDARQQILDPRLADIGTESLEPGDLVFFGKSEHKIMHVGMYLGNDQFIHASSRESKPWIRISSLWDDEWRGHPEAYYPYRTARRLK